MGDFLGGRGTSEQGMRKERLLRGEEDGSTHYIYTYENSIMKPTKHCLKKREEEEENGNIMERVNLFKVHSTFACTELSQ
jgi:hypothetical protein